MFCKHNFMLSKRHTNRKKDIGIPEDISTIL